MAVGDQTPDLTLLGRMVERLQASVDGVRAEHASVRATLNTFDARFAEMNLRLSGLELAQMRLAERMERMETEHDQRFHDLGRKLDQVLAKLG